jgi:hypothetical protein
MRCVTSTLNWPCMDWLAVFNLICEQYLFPSTNQFEFIDIVEYWTVVTTSQTDSVSELKIIYR